MSRHNRIRNYKKLTNKLGILETRRTIEAGKHREQRVSTLYITWTHNKHIHARPVKCLNKRHWRHFVKTSSFCSIQLFIETNRFYIELRRSSQELSLFGKWEVSWEKLPHKAGWEDKKCAQSFIKNTVKNFRYKIDLI